MPPEWPDGQKSHHQARVCTPPDRSHTHCRASASIMPHERTLAALTGGTGWQYSSRVPALPHIYQYFLFLINMSYIFIIRQVKHFPKNSRSAPLFFPSRIMNTTWGREKYRRISVISPVEQSGPKVLCQVPVCLCHVLA